MELKLKALILDEVHNIEVVRLLLEHKVNHVGHWYWQKQLRFYLRNSKCGVIAIGSVTAFLLRCLRIKYIHVHVLCCDV